MRRLSIEAALYWAYRDELPKRGAEWGGSGGATAPGFSSADLGVKVDRWDDEPGFPTILGPPHPDAEIIDAHVQGLETMEVDGVRSRFWLAPECAALIEANDFSLGRLQVDVKSWVIMHARMGTRPMWEVEQWKVERRIDMRTGRTVQVGRDRNDRWHGGSHCPITYVPDPRAVINDRAEYSCWHEAMRLLRDRLDRALQSIALDPFDIPQQPWITGDTPKPMVLPSLTVTLPLQPSRMRKTRKRVIAAA
jgi:hypothetical protein